MAASEPEKALVRACLDPGHSVEDLYQAAIYPDPTGPNASWQRATSFEVDIVVPIATDVMVVATPWFHCPMIALITGVWYGFQNPNCAPVGALANPAYWMIQNNVSAGRNLAKSLTIRNKTNFNTRVVDVKAKMITPSLTLNNVNNTAGLTAAAANNQPVLNDIPTIAAVQSDGRMESFHGSPSGDAVYTILCPVSTEYRDSPLISDRLSPLMNVTPAAGNAGAALYLQYGAALPEAAGVSIVWHASAGYAANAVVHAGFGDRDGSSSAVALLRSDGGAAQTYTIKCNMLHQFILAPGADGQDRLRDKYPNAALVSLIERGRDSMHGIYPGDWNAGGVIGRWFTNNYGKNKESISPLVAQIPWVGGALNSLLGTINTNFNNEDRQQRRNDLVARNIAWVKGGGVGPKPAAGEDTW
jgi:hypothetical protein